MSFTAQGKLLRALQEGEVERVGDTRVRKVDVRVIAATNVNLRDAVKDGSFREDLFFRLNVFPIRVPPLRDPRDDIPLLMNWFMQRACKKHGKAIILDRLFGPRPGQPTKPVVLVEDNGPIHTSKLSMAALAARAHWLTVEWLPKYAPELNDIELVWHDLKAHHLAHQTFADHRPDQPNGSCLFTPPSTTPSTSSAISHPATRSAPSELRLSGRGERLPLAE